MTPEDKALLRQGLAITGGFASWPAAAVEKLLPTARLGRYQRGALVCSEGAGAPEVLILLSGYLMATRANADGSRASISILGPGLVIGLPRGLDTEAPARYDYRAHDSAVVVHLSASAVLDRLDAEPALWGSIARTVLRQHREIVITLLGHLTGSLRQRLAATLSRFARIYGVDEHALKLRLRLSQEDLAAMLQVSRQSINRELNIFEEMGLISAKYGAVLVHDLPALCRLGCEPCEAGRT